MNGGSRGGVSSPGQQNAAQQSSSRMMKTTQRGRPFAKDTHDLFATLIVSLNLTTHRQYFKSYPNSFTTDEAAENLSALKFAQSNRAPDPNEPSRVVTTTTTTTFSMSRDMAKNICQHFMDARLIENAADMASSTFKDKGIYVLTPKGLHILERFITKNGINGEQLLPVFSSQPICMKLLHLERRPSDDELIINAPIVEVIFRRFVGIKPNYPPDSDGESDPNEVQPLDRTAGIEMMDLLDNGTKKTKSLPTKSNLHRHVFTAIATLDWLCDFTTICGRDEAAEVAAHFVRMGFIELIAEKPRKDGEVNDTVVVRGEDLNGAVNEGAFRCHYKAIYGMTDLGRGVARWQGYDPHSQSQHYTSSASSIHHRSSPIPGRGTDSPHGDDSRSVNSSSQHYYDLRGAVGKQQGGDSSSQVGAPSNSSGSIHDRQGIPGRTSDNDRSLHRQPSTSEKFRNDYAGAHAGPFSGSSATDTSSYNSRDSNTNRLKQILEEPALRSLFREFLKANICEENLSFWLDVQDFKRRFHTTSSAVAVRGSGEREGAAAGNTKQGGGVGAVVKKLGRSQTTGAKEQTQYGLTAMERHQQDLIAMAFVIYTTYLAPSSQYELNIEHNIRQELVNYMSRILSEAKDPKGEGVEKINAKDLAQRMAAKTPGSDMRNGAATADDQRSEVQAVVPKAPMHASQLQTMVRLYERIQDHIFRLMATDSVPRFIKTPSFQSLVRSVEEYSEALESGRVDPRVHMGPGIDKSVVEALDLGSGGSGGPPSDVPYTVSPRSQRVTSPSKGSNSR
ncbi:regulator of G protein signaling superfamily [Acaromyces ingoldii]|uniref:Regulator of G protein signaling superfamily n=1 Tax=Acaromyces ingoldii TaxID=215250 RepID=A0A316YYB2_9BASI|nr:regulator of G protein signaling superfamily [Acaromyces ingoldii]PWN94082.1 regulator of G protein signaling superfamily [Acaromyces ingoldii]